MRPGLEQILVGQKLTENTTKQERVFRLLSPVFVKQELREARATLGKRLDCITAVRIPAGDLS